MQKVQKPFQPSSPICILEKKREFEEEEQHLEIKAQSLPSFLEYSFTETKTKAPFIIGVAGGTASGKTSVCKKIAEMVGNDRVVIISQDSYYKNLSEEDLKNVKDYNFDHPYAFDWELLEDQINELKNNKSVHIPHYNFVTHQRDKMTTKLMGAEIIIVEGILIFYKEQLTELMDLKVFVETDDDIRLVRRIRRDTKERGRDIEGVLLQYEKFVKPAFDNYIAPSKKKADIIIPRGVGNTVAIKLIVEHINTKLYERQPSPKSSKTKLN